MDFRCACCKEFYDEVELFGFMPFHVNPTSEETVVHICDQCMSDTMTCMGLRIVKQEGSGDVE